MIFKWGQFCGKECSIVIVYVQWCWLNSYCPWRQQQHGSEPTNQRPGNVRQPIGRWTAETKPGGSSSPALSTGTSLPLVGESKATHPWKFTNLQNTYLTAHRLQRRSNLKTSRYVSDYFFLKSVCFPPFDQTIVSLCHCVNKNKTSWTALTPTFSTYSLPCYQLIRDKAIAFFFLIYFHWVVNELCD